MDIIEIVYESLYSVKYEESQEAESEFERVLDNMKDALYLEEFFEENIGDLQSGFWGEISVEEAVLRTRDEAIRLEKEIIEIAKKGKIDRYETLSTLFKPLKNNPTKIEKFEKNKVTGDKPKSWIRIYAIRIESNLFLITGGAIKLTPNMNDREHLIQELKKLSMVRSYLLDDENYEDIEFFELF